jgi:two-component system, NarL family, nitrate/nitrite response regulator NarL
MCGLLGLGAQAEPARVVIVAPTRLCREGLASALAETPSVHVVGIASERDDDLQRLAGVEGAVVIVDAAVGLSATLPALRSMLVESRLLVFGLSTDEEVLACVQNEVVGYLDRRVGIDGLISAIATVHRGDLVCPPSVSSILIRQVSAAPTITRTPRRLTPRELEIIALLDQGLSNKEIGARLQIEVATVKNHVHNVLEKLNIQRRSDAARRCREEGANVALSFELARRRPQVAVASLDPV